LSIPLIEENDQTAARRAHLEGLRTLVGNVYPNKFQRSEVVEAGREDTISRIGEKFRAFEPKAEPDGRPRARFQVIPSFFGGRPAEGSSARAVLPQCARTGGSP